MFTAAKRFGAGESRDVAEGQGEWCSDLRSEVIVWSEDNYRIFGMSAEEHVSHEEFLDRVHPDDRAAVTDAFEASVARRLPHVLDHRLLLPDGTLKWVQQRWEIFYDEDGRAASAIGTTDDITERMSAIQSLQKSDERFQLVARAMSEVAWDWDIIEDNCWWSDGRLTMFGYLPGVGGKQFWKDNIHPDDRVAVLASLDAAIESGQNWMAEYRFLKADGTYVHVTDRALVVLDDTGKARRMVGAMVDVTEQRILEACLREAQREISVGQLAANMAHEFNNILMGIQPFVEVIRRFTLDIPKVQGATERIAKSLKRGKDITNEILRLTRRAEPVPQPADVCHWLLDLTSEAGPVASDAAWNVSLSKRADLQRRPKLILIVDDESAVVDGISMLLASEGLPSASVSEGAEAITAIQRHAPELVLLDIGLRDVSGIEVFKDIHARWPDLPVILMTGHYSRSDLGSILELPRVRFLQKPFGADELLRVLDMTGS